MMPLAKMASISVLALIATSAAGQSRPTVASFQAPAADDATIPEQLSSPDADPRVGLVSGPVLSIDASSDSSNVALTLAPSRNGLIQQGGEQSWSLTLKAPLNKDTGEGSFVTERGLADQFSAEISFTRIFATFGKSDPLSRQAMLKFNRLCREEARTMADYGELRPEPAPGLSLEARQREFEREYCLPGADWPNLPEATLARFLAPSEIAALRNKQFAQANSPIWLVNGAASLGYGKFKFQDAITFAGAKRKKISYAFSLSAGVSPGRGAPFIGGGYEFKREYSASDKRVVCPAAAPAPTTTSCEFKIFDPPKVDVGHNAFVVVRFTNIFGPPRDSRRVSPFALEIRGGYDFHDRIVGVTVPAYLIADEKGSLRGGVKFSWADRTADSRKDDIRVSLFVAKSFDFFGL